MRREILEDEGRREGRSVSRGVRFIDFTEQKAKIGDEVKAALARVVDSQQFILKENVEGLEKDIAARVGVKHAIGVASGSDALYLSLWALGVGPGDEVVTTPFTFFATAGSISRTGATPVFADIHPETFNLDPAKAEAKFTARTKAVVPVHLFGLSADMDAFQAIAEKRGIAVLEDAAQSYGARHRGRMTAGIGSAGCLSFFPTKNLGGAGDGGMITTNDDALAARLRVLRVHGSKKKYHHEIVGINSRLDELQAAVVRVKLKYVDEWNAKRRTLAAIYDEALRGLPLETPAVPEGYEHVYHLYTIRTDRRDALAAHLTEKKIGHGVYYPLPLHLQPCYAPLGHKPGDFPFSEEASAKSLSLPMYPELRREEALHAADCVRKFFA